MNEKLKIAVLGLGHVGLPTALGFAHIGWDVIGTDSDLDKLNLISNGDTPFYEPGIDQMLEKYLKQGTFKIEKNQVKAIQDAECIFVCVGTPQNDDGSADLSQLETVAKTIAENITGSDTAVIPSAGHMMMIETPDELLQTLWDFASSNSTVC